MAQFSVMVRVVRSVDVEIVVEADTPEKAKEIAEDRSYSAASGESRFDAITEATRALTCDEVGP